MTRMRPAVVSALLCCALAGVYPARLQAAPQEQGATTSLGRIKQLLDKPAAPLKPSGKLELRPTFRSGVEKHPFVPTLEEHLHNTFELTDFQRKYADYAANRGFDLGIIFRAIDKALDERRTRNVREQIRRELSDLEAARRTQNPGTQNPGTREP